MINLQPTLPTQTLTSREESSKNGHEAFFALLHMVNDPTAAKKRLEEIFSACVAANEVILQANEPQKKLDAARKLHEETLRRERAEHEQKITQANSEITSKDKSVNSQLAERERAVKTLEAKAADDAKAVSKLRADLERRTAMVREAAAS
jgi:hypothetical protein